VGESTGGDGWTRTNRLPARCAVTVPEPRTRLGSPGRRQGDGAPLRCRLKRRRQNAC
jgi:hypothetical protein